MSLDDASPSPTSDAPTAAAAALRSRKHTDGKPLPTDSMVTVPLSPTEQDMAHDQDSAILPNPEITVNKTRDSRIGAGGQSLDAVMNGTMTGDDKKDEEDIKKEDDGEKSPNSRERTRSTSSGSSDVDEKVDWEKLDKKEEQEQGGGSDEVRSCLTPPCLPTSLTSAEHRPFACQTRTGKPGHRHRSQVGRPESSHAEPVATTVDEPTKEARSEPGRRKCPLLPAALAAAHDRA